MSPTLPKAWPYRWRLTALALAMLLPSLGTSIANVALPTLETSFVAPLRDMQWVVIAYLLSVTTFIVGAGRLGDLIGRRRLLLLGIGAFAFASAICAVAPGLWVLIAARALQGLGAAIMMALAIASVGDVVPKDRTGSAMGLLGTISAIGTALGPSLGGALISWWSWPAVFALLAGAGIVSLVLARAVIPEEEAPARKSFTFDIAGMLLLGGTLGAFAFSMTGGASQLRVALAVLSMIGLLAFATVERRARSPLIHMELLRDGGLAGGLASIGLVSTIMMATLVVGPFYLSRDLGLTPVKTGLVMSIGPAVAALAGIPAGRLVDRLGTPAVAIGGLTGVLAGSIFMTALPAAFGIGGYVGSLVLITTGYPLFQAANNTAVMLGAARDQRGLISALLGLSRNLGLIAGASAMGALYALGSGGAGVFGFPPGGNAGMRLTFAVAAALAGCALAVTLWGLRPSRPVLEQRS